MPRVPKAKIELISALEKAKSRFGSENTKRWISEHFERSNAARGRPVAFHRMTCWLHMMFEMKLTGDNCAISAARRLKRRLWKIKDRPTGNPSIHTLRRTWRIVEKQRLIHPAVEEACCWWECEMTENGHGNADDPATPIRAIPPTSVRVLFRP